MLLEGSYFTVLAVAGGLALWILLRQRQHTPESISEATTIPRNMFNLYRDSSGASFKQTLQNTRMLRLAIRAGKTVTPAPEDPQNYAIYDGQRYFVSPRLWTEPYTTEG